MGDMVADSDLVLEDDTHEEQGNVSNKGYYGKAQGYVSIHNLELGKGACCSLVDEHGVRS